MLSQYGKCLMPSGLFTSLSHLFRVEDALVSGILWAYPDIHSWCCLMMASRRACLVGLNTASLVMSARHDIQTDLTTLPYKQQLRWLRTRKPLAYRESTCTNLSVSCPYEIIVYSVLKHINTTRMHTIS